MRSMSRRRALGLLGAAGVVAACSSSSKTKALGSSSTTEMGATSCTLAPEVTEGPFFLTDHPHASNLVQDRKGTSLALALTVVGTSCAAIKDAKVDIWHCDATGVYGGFGGDSGGARRGNSDNWLQGYQTTNADGTVRFTTIYPGWYPRRAVHIHVKVFASGNAVHIGQLFFPDDLSDQVFADAPYQGTPDTSNGDDSIYASAGSAALLAPKRRGDGYEASARLVVT